MKTQSKKGSIAEVITSTCVGFIISYISSQVILPKFGYMITYKDTFYVTLWFTAISIIRSYTMRRLFNKYNWFGVNK